MTALKGYVDMKFDVLKGMLGSGEGDAAAAGGEEEYNDESLDELRDTMSASMERMETM